MALSGTLDDFSLIDIIQLVDLGKKTGIIELKGLRDAEAPDGRIFVFEGAVHGAESGALTGINALYSLFLATDGEFELLEDIELPPRTIHVTNASVILEGSSRREAWNHSSAHVPPDTQILRLVPLPTEGPEELRLEHDKWRIVTIISSCPSVGEVVQRAGIGRQRALQMIVELLNAGLVQTLIPVSDR